jgi:glutamyl/glutaminyl-tRNA synthetase
VSALDLAALARRLPPRPLTRFAPSPTGHLHLGHLVNILTVWGVARALGGRVLLRIEDHDRERSRPDFERSILADLAWLGFEADEPPPGTLRQSDHEARFHDALGRLTDAGFTYWCDCSRRRILDVAGTADGELRYDGRCRTRGLGPGPDRGIRVRLDAGAVAFDDARLGPQVQHPAAQCGDVLVRDRLGHWTYQFAVTVDDLEDGVDLIVRGLDLLSSTGRQIALARRLGRDTPPVFLHHGLLYAAGGAKLSKADGATGLRELRAAGLSPEDAIGRAAAAAGLLPAPRPVRADDVALLVGNT